MEDLSQKKFFKITNAEENHHNFQYIDGLNILKEPFAETGSCVPGGLYFTDANNIFEFLDYGVYLREITLPFNDPNFKIVQDGTKWRANKIILGKRYNLWEKETFEYLVSMGADVHAHNDLAIGYASEGGHLDIVKCLVSIGADIRAGDDYAVRSASRNCHLDVVKFLVSEGANIHAKNEYAVKSASENGHLDIVECLVSLGSDIHADNDYAFRSASENGHLEVVKYLVELGYYHAPVQPGRIENNVVVTGEKVSIGVDIHAQNEYAIRYASRNGHLDVVNYLVSVGANIHAENEYPVRHASVNGYPEVVEYLVSIGAVLY